MSTPETAKRNFHIEAKEILREKSSNTAEMFKSSNPESLLDEHYAATRNTQSYQTFVNSFRTPLFHAAAAESSNPINGSKEPATELNSALAAQYGAATGIHLAHTLISDKALSDQFDTFHIDAARLSDTGEKYDAEMQKLVKRLAHNGISLGLSLTPVVETVHKALLRPNSADKTIARMGFFMVVAMTHTSLKEELQHTSSLVDSFEPENFAVPPER